MLEKHCVELKLGTRATADSLTGYDDVILATGVSPRMPDIPGIEHPMVLSYVEALLGAPVGDRVAVIGAGGIGFDVCEFLVTDQSPTLNLKEWRAEWGALGPREAPQARGALTTPICCHRRGRSICCTFRPFRAARPRRGQRGGLRRSAFGAGPGG